MVINTNVPSAYASRVAESSTQNLAKSLAKLSSGSRIITPDDDAAGLGVGMKFSAELKRIGSTRVNVGNAVSFSQTQDGFLGTVDKALRRMSELSVLASDQTKSNDDVANYQKEFAELKSFISRTSTKTFNGTGLFSATALADKELGTNDAMILDRNTNLTAVNATWVTDPAGITNAGNTTIAITGTTAGLFTSTAHGMTTGTEVNIVSQTGSTAGTFFTAVGAATKLYVKNISANTFELYDSAALTTQITSTGAVTAAVLNRSGDYTKLGNLRDAMAQLAGELAQFEANVTNSTANDVSYGSAFSNTVSGVVVNNSTVNSAQTWAGIYDFWQTRTGNSWTGVRAHVDGNTTAISQDMLHVGNAAAVSDSLIENYKKMVSDVQSYVTNHAAGITVTDNSSATTYQLKGADLSTITNAISSATATNTISADLTKTNAGTYTTNLSTLINNLAGSRAYVGANISRLGMVDSQLAVYGENLSAATSRIMDVDIATESSEFAKQQILVQSGTAMLAQANMLPQSALRLLS